MTSNEHQIHTSQRPEKENHRYIPGTILEGRPVPLRLIICCAFVFAAFCFLSLFAFETTPRMIPPGLRRSSLLLESFLFLFSSSTLVYAGFYAFVAYAEYPN